MEERQSGSMWHVYVASRTRDGTADVPGAWWETQPRAHWKYLLLSFERSELDGTAHAQFCTAWIPPRWVGMELGRKGVFKRWDG